MSENQKERAPLSIKELPPLNLVAKKLVDITSNPEVNAEEVSRVLSQDPAIASKVLSLVNSTFYGFSRRISTISRGVVILGNKSIKNLALAFSSMEAFKDCVPPFDYHKFWQHSISVASASQLLAKRLDYSLPEEAFIAGLLHDVGQLLLGISDQEKYKRVLESHDDYLAKEKELFNCSHEDAGKLLLEHWQLPKTFSDVIGIHHSTDLSEIKQNQLLMIVMLADSLSIIKNRQDVCGRRFQNTWPILELAGIPFEEYPSLLSELNNQIMMAERIFHEYSNGFDAFVSTVDHEKKIMVIGADSRRIAWIRALLSFFDFDVLQHKPQVNDILNDPRFSNSFVVFDPHGMETSNITEISQLLEKRPSFTTAFVSGGLEMKNSCLREMSKIPIVFSLEDLNRVFVAHL